MKTSTLGFGIVGTGSIAGVIADALKITKNAHLAGVSSRSIDKARVFAADREGVVAVKGIGDLLAIDAVDAIYVATPTVAKEAIALAAIAAKKHVLVDKPFASHASISRIVEAAAARGLVFMDASHFIHHPRTAVLNAAMTELIGSPRSLHTAIYFPISDHANIRFDPKQEPMTALGDLAWLSMRAVVEYLRPRGSVTRVATAPEYDGETGAIVRASGLISFESGEISTYDIGYTANTVLMDFQLIGTNGVITMDDFVLDWEASWAFKNPTDKAGYFHRIGAASRKDVVFHSTPAEMPQDVAMIDHFAELAVSGDLTKRKKYANAALKTQEYLDAVWEAASE